MSAPTLTKADFQSEQETRWCPGCGDYAILAGVQATMPDLGIPPERVVFVTGIGCAGRFSYYMDTYGMHAIHGRAPAIATGIAAARDDLSVWIVTGDGDALSIGTNHLVHALRRDVPVKILLFNNRIYGLTKGQASPTSERGKITKSTPRGSIEDPIDPIALALGANATFVARTVDRDKKHLPGILRAAAAHPGAALVEVLQNCPVFNDGAYASVTDSAEAPLHRIPLVDGERVVFGADGERCVAREADGRLRIAATAEVPADAILVHDTTRADQALALAGLTDFAGGAVPLGIFRSGPARPWGEGLVAELAAHRAGLNDAALDALLAEGDTWTVA